MNLLYFNYLAHLFGSESSINFAKLNNKMKNLIVSNLDEIISKILEDELLLSVNELQRLEDVQSMVANNAKVLEICKQNLDLVKDLRKRETLCAKKIFTLEFINPQNYREDLFNCRIETLTNDKESENNNQIDVKHPSSIKNLKEQSIVIKPMLKGVNESKPVEIKKNDLQTTVSKEAKPLYLVSKYDKKYCYQASITKNLLYSIRRHKEIFLDYMKTIGTYYAPNIFEFYDLFVKQCISEMLNEELDANINSLDDITNLLIKNELFNLI